jgi:hypothetical protein
VRFVPQPDRSRAKRGLTDFVAQRFEYANAYYSPRGGADLAEFTGGLLIQISPRDEKQSQSGPKFEWDGAR